MKTYLILLLGLAVAGTFIYLVFRFLPLGIAIVIMGACLATLGLNRQNQTIRIIGMLGGWLCPIGIIYSFIVHGWKWGLLSIIIGFVTYSLAKVRSTPPSSIIPPPATQKSK